MLLGMVLLASSCPGAHEGDDPGECSDGADNDRNTYFDCEDHGCTGSPDCATETTEPDATDTGTDPTDPKTTPTPTDPKTTPTDVADLEDYATYTITMQVDWTFPTESFEDCTMIYEGSGKKLEATPTRITFTGPYTRSYTTCLDHAVLEFAFPWYNSITNEALVSFKFVDQGLTLDEWYADPSETTQGTRAEWWMFDMAADYDPVLLFADHAENYVDPSGDFVVFYDVEVSFAR